VRGPFIFRTGIAEADDQFHKLAQAYIPRF
jgi:hypothetical protein